MGHTNGRPIKMSFIRLALEKRSRVMHLRHETFSSLITSLSASSSYHGISTVPFSTVKITMTRSVKCWRTSSRVLPGNDLAEILLLIESHEVDAIAKHTQREERQCLFKARRLEIEQDAWASPRLARAPLQS
ncbi:hypothetical protein GW17_00038519, partial [Ensete ventricosum]